MEDKVLLPVCCAEAANNDLVQCSTWLDIMLSVFQSDRFSLSMSKYADSWKLNVFSFFVWVRVVTFDVLSADWNSRSLDWSSLWCFVLFLFIHHCFVEAWLATCKNSIFYVVKNFVYKTKRTLLLMWCCFSSTHAYTLQEAEVARKRSEAETKTTTSSDNTHTTKTEEIELVPATNNSKYNEDTNKTSHNFINTPLLPQETDHDHSSSQSTSLLSSENSQLQEQ